ncbi:MAG: hypothetical protein CM15mP58_20550 [Burkholderiaceae bacterium]|nr:MAG: hypothetical protein CM15mP58_20550 [Burkholderiaceae bacterium]
MLQCTNLTFNLLVFQLKHYIEAWGILGGVEVHGAPPGGGMDQAEKGPTPPDIDEIIKKPSG